jgi:hypothetical protein
MRSLARTLSLAGAAALLAGCGTPNVVIYLKQEPGTSGPPGQVAPVLAPVGREVPVELSRFEAVLDALARGPSARERDAGYLTTLPAGSNWRSVRVGGETATVELTGREPSFYASAAIAYSLLELQDVDRVVLRLDGNPCCVYTHAQEPMRTLTERTFRYWQGEPCAFRTSRTHARCRSGPSG